MHKIVYIIYIYIYLREQQILHAYTYQINNKLAGFSHQR